MLKSWIMKGVKHGELVIKDSDDSCLRCRMINKARQNIDVSSETRKVSFVIFVVNGLSVLKSMGSGGEDKAEYTKLISQIFNCPYLSYKDDKPAVVVTDGDLLSISDRTRIRLHLQELFGISASEQIFDIPDSCDPVTELAVVDLLRYSLARTDRHLPRTKALLFVLIVLLLPLLLVLVMLIFMGILTSSHA